MIMLHFSSNFIYHKIGGIISNLEYIKIIPTVTLANRSLGVHILNKEAINRKNTTTN